jgi:hypothetical protein
MESMMSFRDDIDALLADMEGKFTYPKNYFYGEGYGRDMKEAYLDFLKVEMPHEEFEGVYPPHAVPLEPPEPEESLKEWRLSKLELVEPPRSIAFGYEDPSNKGRLVSSLPPGIKRYAFFGLSGARPKKAQD